MSVSPTTRKEAAALGLAHFYTGKACKYGHVAQRFVASGACMQCNKENARMFARVKQGGTVRVILEGLHAEDAAAIRDYAAGLQAARDVAAQANAPNIDAARRRLFPELASAPPDYVPPAFTHHPAVKPAKE